MRLLEIEDGNILVKYKPQIDFAIRKYKKHGSAIYRGADHFGPDDIQYFPEIASPREGTSFTNYHNLWTSQSPKWKAFPNRLYSYICSSSSESAEGYGHVRIIIPINNVKIGICPKQDFWYSFNDPVFSRCGGVSGFNGTVYHILKTNGLTSVNGPKFGSYQDLYNALSDGNEIDLSDSRLNTKRSLLELFDTAFTPKDFRLTSWRNYNLKPSDDKEVWFRGECLSIRISLFEKMCEGYK